MRWSPCMSPPGPPATRPGTVGQRQTLTRPRPACERFSKSRTLPDSRPLSRQNILREIFTALHHPTSIGDSGLTGNTIPNVFHFVFGLRVQDEPFHLMYYLCL